jgi:choline-sulfatase
MPDRRPDLVLIVTDQESAPLHWPASFAEERLPTTTRLRRHGLEFTQATCSTAMCSPSRATLMTGRMPAQHGVIDTLSDSPSEAVQRVLDPAIPNLATILKEAGYRVEYRGKWHLSRGADGSIESVEPSDLAAYGFDGWEPPDAGGDRRIEGFGGGTADHDAHYLAQAIAFLEEMAAAPADRPPFCLVVCLINPHDVLGYPDTMVAGGYRPEDADGDLPLPASYGEDLTANRKPPIHELYRQVLDWAVGAPEDEEDARRYVNFYAHLYERIDRQLAPLVDLLYDADGEPTDLGRSTIVVRTSDHGELAYAHGLRQKAFNVYEESMRVPLVVSNPELFPEGAQTDALASLVDLLPTLIGLAGATPPPGLRGVDLGPVLADPTHPGVQDDVLFTYDDVRAGMPVPREVLPAANRIRCVRERDWKYARYFHAEGAHPEAFELYDLTADPGELENLAHPDHPRYDEPAVRAQRERLAARLAERERALARPTADEVPA